MKFPQKFGTKLLLLAAYAVFVGIMVAADIPCLIRHFTGVICPGCGMSRAWLSLLQLDLRSALEYHPMFWSVPVFLLYIFYDGCLFRHKKLNDWILFSLLGAFLLCYCIRLIVFLGGNLTI